MQHNETQILKIVVLILLATGLGIAILQLDSARRSQVVPDANAAAATTPQAAPATAQAQSTAPAASPAEPAAQLVADPGTPAVPEPTAAPVVRRISDVECNTPHRLVQVERDAAIHATPGGRAIGTLPSSSRYLGQATTAWVQAVTADGRWGRVTVPWSKPVNTAGWVRIDEMAGRTTDVMVVADLSDRLVRVYRGCEELFRVQSAIGRPGSPSPKGRFWVTDRVPVPGSQRASFGSYAFGLSTVQPNLPAGWTGGDQMAIHGTGAPGSIGQAASAGCLRVSEAALAKLKPLLRVGTPVIIKA